MKCNSYPIIVLRNAELLVSSQHGDSNMFIYLLSAEKRIGPINLTWYKEDSKKLAR